MKPFDKTATTLVRPHPFSTLYTTPLGKMTLWNMNNSVIQCMQMLRKVSENILFNGPADYSEICDN